MKKGKKIPISCGEEMVAIYRYTHNGYFWTKYQCDFCGLLKDVKGEKIR